MQKRKVNSTQLVKKKLLKKKKKAKLQLTLQDILHLCQHGLCPNIVLPWKQLGALPSGLCSPTGRGRGEGRWDGRRGRREAGGKPQQAQLTSPTPHSELKMSCGWHSPCLFLGIEGSASAEKEHLPQSQASLQGSDFSAFFTNIFLWEGRQRWGKCGRGESNSYFCLACYIRGLIYGIPRTTTVSF